MVDIDFGQVVTAEIRAATDLAQAKQVATENVNLWVSEVVTSITGPVPERIVDSWTCKAAAARAMIDGAATEPQKNIIRSEAAFSGEAPDDLAEKIAANADAYEQTIAALEGLRRVALGRVFVAKTPEAAAEAVADMRTKWVHN